jgi:hypothetical protein
MGVRLLSRRTVRRTVVGISLGVSTMSLCATAIAMFSGAAFARPASARPPVRGLPQALAARVISLNLKTTMHLVGLPGHVTYSKGTVTGSLPGTASARFVALSSNRGESTFAIYPSSGGSLVGRSATHGYVAGPTVYFSGTATITGGTGRWAHAHGTGLTFSGALNRQNYHSTLVTHGNVSV